MNISVPDELAEQVRTMKIPISETCQRALRDAVETARLRDTSGMQEITVEIGQPPVKVGFVGRWLLEPHPDQPHASERGVYYGVALTKRGRIAVWSGYIISPPNAMLADYGSLEEAAQAVLPRDLAEIAADRLTTDDRVVWRDI
jgi:hypothetical protein